MNHSHVSADTQTGSTKDSFQITQQIVEQAKLISRDQNSEMVIKLNPEHLGELTVKVTVEHTGLVTATFHSSNSDVRAVIESSLTQLKQELANAGLKVDNVGVYTSLNQFMSNQERPTQQQPKIKFSSKRNGDTFDDAVDALEKTAVTGTDGVDYLV
jgi:flagellar hook-length control protein FliK